MFGSGGVPVYCARSMRGMGEPDMLGLPEANSGTLGLGLEMLTGFEGVGLFEGGDDMVGGDGGWGERDECGVAAF